VQLSSDGFLLELQKKVKIWALGTAPCILNVKG